MDQPSPILADARDLARRLGALPFVDVVWLFGRAARGTATRASDLDLAISAPRAGAEEWHWVREVVERAPTLRRVDAVRWEDLGPSDPLRASVLRDRVLLYEREPGLSERADDFAASHELLRSSLARLREGLARLSADPTDEMLRDATIQRFEFSSEQFWKTLRHALDASGAEPGISPRGILRVAVAARWIEPEGEAQGGPWRAMIEDRNRTSHAYKKKVADEVLSRVPDHLARMEALAARLPALVADGG